MPGCAIVTCKHSSKSVNLHTDGITFHRFPSKPEIKEKWIAATCRGPVWWPLKTSTICSVHFEDNQFRPLPKSRRLFEWAVPSMKLPQVSSSLSSNHDSTKKTHYIEIEVLKKPSDVPVRPDAVSDSLTEQFSEDEEPFSPKMNSANDTHNTVETLFMRKMSLQLERYKSALQQRNRKIKMLQKKTSRYRKRIINLQSVIKKYVNSGHVNKQEI